MSKKLAGLDRFLVFLFAVVFLALGLWLVALWGGCPPAEELLNRFDHDAVAAFPDSRWYTLTLVAVLILGVILGLWLIIANLRAHRFSRSPSPASNRAGTIELDLNRLAGAIDDALEEQPRVQRVRHRAALDRSRPTITWTLVADPNVDLPTLRQTVEATERDFRDAVGEVDVDTRYRIHLEPVDR